MEKPNTKLWVEYVPSECAYMIISRTVLPSGKTYTGHYGSFTSRKNFKAFSKKVLASEWKK